MFAAISPRYDLLNHLLSLNLDRGWRRAAARAVGARQGERVLDLCTGTGDLAIEVSRALARSGSPGESGSGPGIRGAEGSGPGIRGAEGSGPEAGGLVIGADFTREMLTIAAMKASRCARVASVRFAAGDALDLPFATGAFDAVTAAFGVRNFEDLDRGLDEILRVLRPGGRAVILEFAARRGGPIDAAFRFYFHHLLPRVGGWISGSREGKSAYAYLPASVLEFPSPAELAAKMEARGFRSVRHRMLSLGVVSLHVGFRPAVPQEVLEPREAASEMEGTLR